MAARREQSGAVALAGVKVEQGDRRLFDAGRVADVLLVITGGGAGQRWPT